jgi:hypothetical protein
MGTLSFVMLNTFEKNMFVSCFGNLDFFSGMCWKYSLIKILLSRLANLLLQDNSMKKCLKKKRFLIIYNLEGRKDY